MDCQKTPTTKPILTHMIGLDMMKKMLRARSEINLWLACTKAKMLQKELLQDIMLQKELLQDITLICPFCTPVKSSNECYHFKHAPKFKMQSHTSAEYLASDKGWESF